ncbi:unnamed protein product [Acanthoscelides obtectus]|uniref:Uncharacterized protein n=1 Tax=Acanthoscelides obtectus TaxID=200917 RepID=A0A9P0L5X0_ACAOB|nr:unnamed protein product [Acanthoscelides obtectus]CAK1640500.1 hypothetical protein AOBTE_LOCUS11762 [Acanthoscelides obtectus]
MSRPQTITEPLPFRLVGMTEAELYEKINAISQSSDLEYQDIPSGESDNDSASEQKDLDAGINLSEPENMLLPEIADEEIVEPEGDPEDLVPLSELQKLWKIKWTKDIIKKQPENFENAPGLQLCRNCPIKYHITSSSC